MVISYTLVETMTSKLFNQKSYTKFLTKKVRINIYSLTKIFTIYHVMRIVEIPVVYKNQ